MAKPEKPYSAFNFLVKLCGSNAQYSVLGGFSDVSAIATEINIAEYRYRNDSENHLGKISGLHHPTGITLKRGIVNSRYFRDWIYKVRQEGPLTLHDVSITLRDEAGQTVQTWVLHRVMPSKYTAPALNAKGDDVAMEELVLTAEAVELEIA